jgi:hypothetical protein
MAIKLSPSFCAGFYHPRRKLLIGGQSFVLPGVLAGIVVEFRLEHN